jgi:hypothetical protein
MGRREEKGAGAAPPRDDASYRIEEQPSFEIERCLLGAHFAGIHGAAEIALEFSGAALLAGGMIWSAWLQHQAQCHDYREWLQSR